jgi:hypothetical protein
MTFRRVVRQRRAGMFRGTRFRRVAGAGLASTLCVFGSAWAASPAQGYTYSGVAPNKYGGLDCNGLSRIQKSSHPAGICVDIRNPKADDGRFWDNGRYIGHDEPDLNALSSQPGSGNNVSWTFTLGKDPAAAATVAHPGSDVSHYVELTPAIWFSMPICDPQSYPLLPCTPKSDANTASGNYPGGGSAFMELQFYPPGFGPWVDAPSFDNTHWGAALTIDSLEATDNFTNLNFNCIEPVNFSFIQTNGIPPGPPSPQLSNLASNEPNAHTLLMNPGDKIQAHVFDAAVPNSTDHALKAVVTDLTTGKTGFIQASAANGFMNTSPFDCSGTPFNFEPEYNTAKAGHNSPWGAGTEGVSMAYEIGHFIPCTAVTQPQTIPLPSGASDTFWNSCSGPYENSAPGGDGGSQPEASDAFCFPKGDTHGGLATNIPDTITGCEDNLFQNGDLDFDGSGYWKEWPTATTANTYPSTFAISPPVTGTSQYSQFQFQTDAAFSEQTTCNPGTPQGCVVPPPNAPGNFYPYWTLVSTTGTSGTACTWEFGNMANGTTFGKDAQYGSIIAPTFPDLVSAPHTNTCTS